MVLLIGLAVGVDYSMFYLKREREERAAGRSERGRARGRRRDLRPLGADLRPDGDGGDGRHVPDRRRDVRLARARDDPRRRRGGARLADRAPGAALAARRQGRPAARPARRPAAAATTARAGIWGAIVDRVLRRPAAVRGPRRRRCCWRSPRRRCSCASRTPGPDTVPEVARRRQDLQPDAAGVPRHGAARQRRRQGAERERAGDARRRSRSSSGGRSRAAAHARADHGRRQQATRTVANITVPIDGNGTDAASNARLRTCCATTIVPQTVGAAPERRGRRHRADGRMEGPGRPDEVEAAARRRLRARCSRSR